MFCGCEKEHFVVVFQRVSVLVGGGKSFGGFLRTKIMFPKMGTKILVGDDGVEGRNNLVTCVIGFLAGMEKEFLGGMKKKTISGMNMMQEN